MGNVNEKQLVAELAKSSGVSESDVSKVLKRLGMSKALANVTAAIGPNASKVVSLKNTKLAFRIAKSTVSV